MPEKLRITMVLPAAGLSGGIRVLAIYADGLQRRGHQVVVVSRPWPAPSFKAKLRSLLKGQGFPRQRPLGPSHFDKLAVDHRVLERVRPVTDADVPDADVVVATWWDTAPAVAALSDRKGAKAYFMQDYGAAGQPMDKLVPTWRLPMHVITIAPWLKDLMMEHGVAGDSIDLAFNGVDTDLFQAPRRGKQPRPTIGFVYTGLPEKGVDTALAAIAQVRREVSNLRVIAFGPSKSYEHLPLPEGAEYFAALPDAKLPEIYRQCDAWLFSSRREGFGLPILEAMACRTPVIATPAGVAPQLLADGGGLLLQAYDAATMAQAIVKLVGMDDASWRTMSDIARATAMRYPWSAAIDAFEAGLHRAVDRAARRQIAGGAQPAPEPVALA